MDEIVFNNEVETELIIDKPDNGKEETPIIDPVSEVPLITTSETTSTELYSSIDNTDNLTLAPDAITENGSADNLQSTEPETETSASGNIHSIDEIYTLLSDGVTVKIQSESETESIESESEITLSQIYSKLEETRLLESESLLQINNNVVKANNNDNILGFISISLLSALLGGIVAIGFLKGLR